MRKIATIVVVFAVAVAGLVAPQAAFAAAHTTAPAKNTKPTKVAQATDKKESADKQPVKVTVAEGDSLSSIAEKHSTTWVRLYNANETVAHPDVINPGQELRVPAADEQLTERALPQPPAPVAVPVQTSYQAPAQQTYTRPTPAAATYPVDANGAKATIYARESGNNPNATNPSGCYGIGQDCNGVVRTQCGADYACQDQYFTNYMASRYGSWEAALAFWNANGWW